MSERGSPFLGVRGRLVFREGVFQDGSKPFGPPIPVSGPQGRLRRRDGLRRPCSGNRHPSRVLWEGSFRQCGGFLRDGALSVRGPLCMKRGSEPPKGDCRKIAGSPLPTGPRSSRGRDDSGDGGRIGTGSLDRGPSGSGQVAWEDPPPWAGGSGPCGRGPVHRPAKRNTAVVRSGSCSGTPRKEVRRRVFWRESPPQGSGDSVGQKSFLRRSRRPFGSLRPSRRGM